MTAECRVCGEVKRGPVPVGRAGQLSGGTVVEAGQPSLSFVCVECLTKAELRQLQQGRLLFFPDYGADPVWDAQGKQGMIRLDGLPVREETRRDVREWAKRWEQMAEQEVAAEDFSAGLTKTPVEPVQRHEWDALERDGRGVWIRLCEDLGDEWTVGWASFTDTGRQVEWSPGAPPEPLPAPGR
jgi:hypothetical protein